MSIIAFKLGIQVRFFTVRRLCLPRWYSLSPEVCQCVVSQLSAATRFDPASSPAASSLSSAVCARFSVGLGSVDDLAA